MKKFLADKWFLVGIGIILFFTLAYILLILNRYWQFDYFFPDNVYFDTALWKVAHGLAPIIRHNTLGQINILGDHFHPTIFLFSLLYLISPHQEIIFVGMAVIYGLSAILGLIIGFKIIKSRFTVLALIIAYFLYLGTQNAFIYGFHEVNLMPLFFLLTMAGLVFDKKNIYWLGLAFLLLTKESYSVVGVMIGFFTWWSFPQKRKTAIATIILAVIYFLAVTKFVIPSFSGRYLYGEVSYPKDLSELVSRLIIPSEKLKTIFVSFASFGFLPILNIAALPLILQDLFLRFVFAIPGTVQYSLDYHYNLALAPLLLFSSFWSLRKFDGKFFGVLVLILSFIFLRFNNPRGPLLLVLNKDFYANTQKNLFTWNFLSKVPRNEKIMTQNQFGYVLDHSDVYQIVTKCDKLQEINPDLIVVDLRRDQNPNNFVPITYGRTKNWISYLLKRGDFKIYYQDGQSYILQKIRPIKYEINEICPEI